MDNAATPGWAVAVLLILLIAILGILVYEVFIKEPPQAANNKLIVESAVNAVLDSREDKPSEVQLSEETITLLTKHTEALDEWNRLMNAVEVVRMETPSAAPKTTGFEVPPVTSGMMLAVCAACGRKHTEENPIQFDFELLDFLCKEDREDLTDWSSYSPLDSPKEWLAMRQATRDNDVTKG